MSVSLKNTIGKLIEFGISISKVQCLLILATLYDYTPEPGWPPMTGAMLWRNFWGDRGGWALSFRGFNNPPMPSQ